METQIVAGLIAVVTALVGLVSFNQRQLFGIINGKLDALIAGQGVAVSTVTEVVRSGTAIVEARLERVTRAIELSAQADMLRLLASPETSAGVKEEARRIVTEITDARS